MNAPVVALSFAGHADRFAPGEALTVEHQVEHATPGQVVAVELSVLWRTEGKGDEDIGVHLFKRYEPGSPEWRAGGPTRFTTQLPRSPLSYDGAIVKIKWCVRGRAFLHDGKEIVHERQFFLGHVKAPPATAAYEPAPVLLY